MGVPDQMASISDPGDAWYQIAVDGGSVTLMDSNGQSIAPKGGNENGIEGAKYSWDWSESGGKFTFSGTGEDTVRLASNKAAKTISEHIKMERLTVIQTVTLPSSPVQIR